MDDLALSQYEITTNPHREGATWAFIYGGTKVYVTPAEKEAALKAFASGREWVEVKGTILTKHFLCVAPNDILVKLEQKNQEKDARSEYQRITMQLENNNEAGVRLDGETEKALRDRRKELLILLDKRGY